MQNMRPQKVVKGRFLYCRNAILEQLQMEFRKQAAAVYKAAHRSIEVRLIQQALYSMSRLDVLKLIY